MEVLSPSVLGPGCREAVTSSARDLLRDFFSILSLARFTVERRGSISAFCFALYSLTFLAKTSTTLLFGESRTGGKCFRQFFLIRGGFHGRNPTTAQAFLITDGSNALVYAL